MRAASLFTALLLATPGWAGEGVRLSSETWDRVPGGKEVDALYGDWVLRNDKVVAIIADARPDRNLHLSVRHVQGALIDFSPRGLSNDQLTAFLPHRDGSADLVQAHRVELVKASGPEVALRVVRDPTEADPVGVETTYSLRDGDPALYVATRYRNTGAAPARTRVSDKMRCDQTFLMLPGRDLLVFHDRWFGAAYGIGRADGLSAVNPKSAGLFGPGAGTWIDYPGVEADKGFAVIEPAKELVIERFLLSGRDAAQVQREAAAVLKREPAGRTLVRVVDPAGAPVADAHVAMKEGERTLSAAATDADGAAVLPLPPAGRALEVEAPGRAPVVSEARGPELRVRMEAASAVELSVVDGEGRPIPCKAQFVGADGTKTPDFGPKQRARCANLWHSPEGRFSVPVPSGRYYVVVSRGPEHDAVHAFVDVKPGATARLAARLPRVVDTRGWVSADFHNHSTESGDNTTDTDSRLVCLAAEHVEFAAATEHNRTTTYKDRLKRLGLDGHVATSDGIELTGQPLLLNHHNAFPLVHVPRTQDGGGPAVAKDPLTQLRRLLDHDAGSEKLLQQNHPDIGWLFYDADGDGEPDMGFGTAKYTDVIEVWRPTILKLEPMERSGPTTRNHRTFNWLQLLNQGIRIPAVANTDAHYCTHESGKIRNYVRSSTDDPSAIDEMEIVRQSKKGRIVMTNGPFLEVSVDGAGPGDTVRSSGRATLKVRVQCANWLDVDRLQVLLNGRAEPSLNFTRASHAAMFRDGVVKLEAEIPLELARDTHVIVVATAEGRTLGPVMGATAEAPTAISNPIWVDVGPEGFEPSKDTLGHPLPVKR